MTSTAIESAVSQIVRYRLSEADGDAIRGREARKLGDPPGSALSTGLQLAVGDHYPLIVVLDHGNGMVGGWLQLPAIAPLWVYVARRGDGHGEWQPAGA